MKLHRRDALKYSLAVLAGIGAAATATPTEASADEPRSTEVNVKDHGATGNGTTDDTAAIHAARNAAGVGGQIIIPPGIYMVNDLRASVENQTWKLSDSAVIKMIAGARRTLSVNGAGVSIVGGLFDASNSVANDGSQHCISINADRVAFRGVTVQNSSFYAIGAYDRNQITISECTFINNRVGIFVQNSLPAPSNIYDIVITDNVVEGSGQYASGITVFGDSIDQRVNRVTVSRNTVRLPNTDKTGNETGGLCVYNGADWIVENNFVVGTFIGISCPSPLRAAVVNNVVRGFWYVGIELPGVVSGVAVTGNVVDGDGDADAGIQTSAGALNDVSIFENKIANCSVAQINFGSGAVVNKATVDGNILTAATSNFAAVLCNSSVVDLTMSGNTVDGTTSANSRGIEFLRDVRGATLSGNQFNNLKTAVVLMASSTPSSRLDHIKVTGNAYANCGPTLLDRTSNGAVVGSNVSTTDGFIPGVTSTVTAASTTTLSVSSTDTQRFTGTSTQLCVLPTTDIAAGRRYTIINGSTGLVTVKASDGSAIVTLAPNTSGVFTALQATPQEATHWRAGAYV